MIPYWIAPIYSLLLFIDDNIQDFSTRWDKALLSVSKVPSDGILESLYTLRVGEFAQHKTVLALYDMEIHLKIPTPNHQKLKTMEKKGVKIRNSDCETLTPGMRKLNQEQWSGIERD